MGRAFQRFLQDQEQLPARQTADELHTALATVNQLITFLTNEKRQQGSAISEILLANHPAFDQIRKLTACPYPVFFRTRKDLENWLFARGWRGVVGEEAPDPSKTLQWKLLNKGAPNQVLSIAATIFKQDKLKVFTNAEWNSDWIVVSEEQAIDGSAKDDDFEDFPGALNDEDDDLPF